MMRDEKRVARNRLGGPIGPVLSPPMFPAPHVLGGNILTFDSLPERLARESVSPYWTVDTDVMAAPSSQQNSNRSVVILGGPR
jgi:hypothetical protein